MRCLLIGATGYIGSRLYDSLTPFGITKGTYNNRDSHHPDYYRLDLSESASVGSILRSTRPDIIVHSGGMIGTDLCEKKKEEATAANVSGTGYIMEHFKGKIIYLSTNYVFDGRKGGYVESDEPNPINHYGWTKLESEKMILSDPQNLVVRLGSVYGCNTKNDKFLSRFFDGGKAKEQMYGCKELMLSPTFLDDICANMERFMSCNGIIHMMTGEPMNEFDFFSQISERLDIGYTVLDKEFSELQKVALRPKDATMATEYPAEFQRTGFPDSLDIVRRQMSGK